MDPVSTPLAVGAMESPTEEARPSISLLKPKSLSSTSAPSRRGLSPNSKKEMVSVEAFTDTWDKARLARAVRKRQMHWTNEKWDDLVKHVMFLIFFTICMSRTLHKQDHYWVGNAIKSQAIEMEFLPTDVANWGKAFQDIATVQEFEQVNRNKLSFANHLPIHSRYWRFGCSVV
jgi:hypothetical protein